MKRKNYISYHADNNDMDFFDTGKEASDLLKETFTEDIDDGISEDMEDLCGLAFGLD